MTDTEKPSTVQLTPTRKRKGQEEPEWALKKTVLVEKEWTPTDWHMWSLDMYAATNLVRFDRITELDFGGNKVGNAGLQVISYVLGRPGSVVRVLCLETCLLDNECVSDVRAICGNNIRSLDLRNNYFTIEGVRTLLQSVEPKRLFLAGNEGITGVLAVSDTVEVDIWKKRRLLEGKEPDDGDAAMVPLIALMPPDTMIPYKVFELVGDTSTELAVLRCIRRDPPMEARLFWRISLSVAVKSGLHFGALELSYTKVDVAVLAATLPKMKHLRLLSLGGCNLTWEDVNQLAPKVAILNLCANNLSNGPIAQFYEGLDVLLLGNNKMTDAGVTNLNKALVSRLSFLDLSYNIVETKEAAKQKAASTDVSKQSVICTPDHIKLTDDRMNWYYPIPSAR